MRGWDVEAVRGDFPGLARKIGDHPLVYLDNAASAQKPRSVIDAITTCYENGYANIHRGVHRLSQEATATYEGARRTVAEFLNAAEDEIIFVRGATEGINLVAHSFLAPRLEPGDEVLVSEMEHHANIVPWQLACEARGARLRVLPMDDRGELRIDELDDLLTDRTRLLAVTQVSNALGTVNPLPEVLAAAHQRGVPVLVDGAQAVPHGAVDVAALGADFYVFSGHKVFGPAGIGVLFARRSLLESMPPYQGGGDMIRRVTFEGTTFAPPPGRFEAGTPNIEGAVGLAAALDYLQGLDQKALTAHEQELLSTATERLQSLPGARLVGTPRHRRGAVSFVLDGIHPHDIGTILDQRGIAIRAGHHCAQPVMDHFRVPATVRASFAFYNTPSEVDALLDGLAEVVEIFS
ncbi:MAG: cysteine desulfurase [Acidobacteriota bacterium]|nr:cysteine desulfurase [Acidobacteriota bacterium]